MDDLPRFMSYLEWCMMLRPKFHEALLSNFPILVQIISGLVLTYLVVEEPSHSELMSPTWLGYGRS